MSQPLRRADGSRVSYPHSDRDTKSNRLAELEFSPIATAFRPPSVATACLRPGSAAAACAGERRYERGELIAPKHLGTSSATQGRVILSSISESMRYLISALDDLGEMFIGRRIAPIDMANQDALARAAGVPVCALLGQHRVCAGVQQQWPLVEISDGLASEAVGWSECGGGRRLGRRSQAPIQIADAQHIAFVLAPVRRIGNVPSETILGL